MLKAHLRLKGIKDGFDDEALTQHDLVSQRRQVVPHVAADTSNEGPAALACFLELVLRDLGLGGGGLAWLLFGTCRCRGAVGGVGGGLLGGHVLPLVVDDECQQGPKNGRKIKVHLPPPS